MRKESMEFDEYRKKIRRLMAISCEFGMHLTARSNHFDPRPVTVEFLDSVVTTLEGVAGAVWIRDPSTGLLDIYAPSGLPQAYIDESRRMSVERRDIVKETPVYRCYLSRTPMLFDVTTMPEGHPFQAFAKALGFDHLYLAPLICGEECVGTLALYHPGVDALDRDDLLSWTVYAAQQFAIGYVQFGMREELTEMNRCEREDLNRLRLQELEEANAKLREQDKQKDEILGIVSHELKNPLVTISGHANQLLRRCKDLPENQIKSLQHIEQNADRMQGLIADLLDYSRIQTGRMSVHLTPTPYKDLIEDFAGEVRPLTEAKGIKFDILVPTSAEPAIDAPRIRQVLHNLFSNALKFTPEGGTISIVVVRQGNDLTTVVTDSGIGIERQDMPELYGGFDPNSKGPQIRAGGNGLGLAISQAIVKAHGGWIQTQSNPKVGTQVIFTLPISFANV